MDKKFLLRMSEEKYRILGDLSGSVSLNQYINDVLDQHIDQKKGRTSRMEKIIIEELRIKDVREAITVTQNNWYMELLNKHNLYFFSSNKIVTPMMYILFYGDSSCSPAKCVSHVGKVSHIYRHVHKDELISLSELQGVMNDPLFSNTISSWQDNQIAVLSEVAELVNPIPLTGEYINHPRIIVNRTTSMVEALSALKMDDLFN